MASDAVIGEAAPGSSIGKDVIVDNRHRGHERGVVRAGAGGGRQPRLAGGRALASPAEKELAMRILLMAGLLCLAACGKSAQSSAGATAASTTPGAGPSDASGGGGKYACVMTYEGKTVTCTAYSDFGSEISLAGSKRACAAPNLQTVAAACPSQDLIGCCTHKDAGGSGGPTGEYCSYKGPMAGTAGPATCAQSGGAWSPTP